MYHDILILAGLISLVGLSFYLGRRSYDFNHMIESALSVLAKDNIVECYENKDDDLVVYAGTKRPTEDEMKKLSPFRFNYDSKD